MNQCRGIGCWRKFVTPNLPDGFLCVLGEPLAYFAVKAFNREARKEKPQSLQSRKTVEILKLHNYQISLALARAAALC